MQAGDSQQYYRASKESGKAFLTVKWEEIEKTLTSGKAGNNITYTCKDGVLRFTGTGAMYDYHSQQLPEWTCANYKELYIDSRITAIGDYCFFGVTTDKLSGFPTSLTRAGNHSFAEAVLKCNGTDLVINIKTIEDYAFYEAGFGGSNGKSVSIKGAEYIGEFALKGGRYFGVSSLKVDLSNAVYIGKGAFQYFHFDDTFSVLDKVEYIGDEAFYCSKGSVETKLHLPPTLTYLGEKAFYECEWLASDAYIDGDNLTFNNNVFAYTYVDDLTFGPGVVAITSGGLMYSRVRRNGDSNVVTVTFLGNKPEFMRNSGANYSGNNLVCNYPADDKTWYGIRDKNTDPNAYSYSSIVFEPYGEVTVNFFDVAGTLVYTKVFDPGKKISEPSANLAGLGQGQTFTGWFKDKDIHNSDNRWVFDNPVYYSMDLYAGVDKEMCTVRFVTNCDITVDDVVLKKGESISGILDDIEKNQLYFPDKAVGGWYTDSALRNWFSKGQVVTEDLTLYVKWTGEGLYLYRYDGIYPIPWKEFYEYGRYMGGVSRSAHYFRGYYSNPDFEGEPITYIVKGEIEPESSIYAKWEPVEAAKITVTGYESSVYYTGAAITFPDLEVCDGGKKLTPGKDYTVKYKNNRNVGKAEMVFTFKGTQYSGSKTVSFTIKPLNIGTMKDKDKTLTLDRGSVYLNPNGKYQKPKFKLTAVVGNKTVVLKEKTDYKVIYVNLDPENRSYKADAYKAVGDYTVWIDGCGNFTGRIHIPVHIQDKKPVEKLKATVKNTTLDSEGKLVEPVVTVYDGRTLLVRGVDYEVSFDNPPVIGTNRVTISAAPGSEKYVGERYVSFKVTAVPMSKASIVGFAKVMPYEGGDPVEQTLELYKDSKSAKNRVAENKLVYGTDYTIRYENNTSAGTATMYIVGMGRRYSGTVKKTFTIPGTNIKSAKTEGIENRNYSGKAQTMDLKLFFQKNSRADKEYLMNSMEESKFRDMDDSSRKRAVQWTYRYVNNVNPGTAKIVITGVNGYIGSITRTFRINVMDKKYAEDAFSVKVDKKVTYTKGGACPEPVVKFGDEFLTKGVDYTVSYKDNKKQGTAKVTVTLKGKFKGSFTDTFEIVPADFSKCTVVADDVAYEYKKGNAKTSVAVYDINGAKLQPGVDYDTDFEYLCDEAEIEDIDSYNSGLGVTLEVVVTGKGNYAGKEARGSYRIVNKSIKDAVVTLRDGKTTPYKEYTGEPQIFFQNDIYVKLKGKSYSSLSNNDYEILGFRNNVEMGTAVMIIKGKEYYGGILEVPFKIVKKTVK